MIGNAIVFYVMPYASHVLDAYKRQLSIGNLKICLLKIGTDTESKKKYFHNE